MDRRLVVVTDSVFPNLDPAREILSKIGADLQLAPDSTPETILRVAEYADAVLTTYAKVTGDMVAQLRRCRIISRFGIGVDNVDIATATQMGIVVTRVPDYCFDEVSDHAMALLLALVRKISFIDACTQRGTWEMRRVVPIHRVRGTVLGLVGFGGIPRMVAPKAQAFGMQVVAFDPYISEDVFTSANVARVEFDELLKISDYISIHSPLTSTTHHLFNAGTLSRMKRTAYLINTARGPIVDETALGQALDRKEIAGAALDVMENEPATSSPLFGRDNVIITPHMSFYSEESLVDLQTKAAEEVVRVLSGVAPRSPVNPEAWKSGVAISSTVS